MMATARERSRSFSPPPPRFLGLHPTGAGPLGPARVATPAGPGHTFSGLPVLQRQPADADADPPWDSSLLLITFDDDVANECYGIATSRSISLYSDCGPVRPPFCQSARVPFEVEYFVDRASRPHPRPQGPRTVSAQLEFKTTGGRITYQRSETDDAPRYVGPNLSLEPRFGRHFTVGSTESGRLTVSLSLVEGATSVRYDDRIDYDIRPCT